MMWKHLWLIPAQTQFYWKFTFYMKGYFFLWSEFWVHRENFLALLGSAGKSRPVTVILSSVTHVSLIFHLRGNSGYQTLCSAFRVYFIIELVAVRSATLLKNFLDCCMSVFTQPKKFPWRKHPKSQEIVRNRRALEKLTVWYSWYHFQFGFMCHCSFVIWLVPNNHVDISSPPVCSVSRPDLQTWCEIQFKLCLLLFL